MLNYVFVYEAITALIIAFWGWIQYRFVSEGRSVFVPLAAQLGVSLVVVLILGPLLRLLGADYFSFAQAFPNLLSVGANVIHFGGWLSVVFWSLVVNVLTAATIWIAVGRRS